MSRTQAPSDVRVRGLAVVRQDALRDALGATGFGLYCALLDARSPTTGVTLTPLADVARRVFVEAPAWNKPAPATRPHDANRLSLEGARWQLKKLIDAGLVRMVGMVAPKKAPTSGGGWRAKRVVYGCLIGPVTGTVWVPSTTEKWMRRATKHGGHRWSASTHPETAFRLHAAQQRGGAANAERVRKQRETTTVSAETAEGVGHSVQNKPNHPESLNTGGAIKTPTPLAVKAPTRELSRPPENTNKQTNTTKAVFPSEKPLRRLPPGAEARAGEVSETKADARGRNLRDVDSSRGTDPSRRLAALDGVAAPPTPLDAFSERFDASDARCAEPVRRRSVEELRDLGLPRIPSAFEAALVVAVDGCTPLVRADTLERKVELVRRMYEGAVVDYAGMPRPKVLGHPKPMRPSKRGLWPLFAKAVEAFEHRDIPPAAWFAYWVDEWALQKPGEAPPLQLVLSPLVILRPRGFFSGPATGYAAAYSRFLPEVRDYAARVARLHEAAGVLSDATPAALAELVAQYFPDGVDEELERLRVLVSHEQREARDRRDAGRWVWDRRTVTKQPRKLPSRRASKTSKKETPSA